MKKGQTSIEFMLLIVIVLMYIQTVITPNLNETLISVSDTTRVAEARLATEKLTNAINYVAASNSESKTTVNLFLPERTIILCDEGKKIIGYETELDTAMAKCGILDGDDSDCDKNFSINPTIKLVCSTPPFGEDKIINASLVSNPITLYIERSAAGTVVISGNIS